MWSGGRSLRKIAVAGGFAVSLGTAAGQLPLCNGQHPGSPELLSGAASCVYNELNGVGQTLIDLSDSSVIRWNHFALRHPDSSLTFQWSGDPSGNATVLNRVEGFNAGRDDLHDISGTVQFLDGNLIINNPNSTPQISGTVAARSLIFTTHRLDPAMEQALLGGQQVDFLGAQRNLEINDGRLVATQGDLVLAGRAVQNTATNASADDAPELEAQLGSVRIFGGENFRLLSSGQERVVALPGARDGSVRSSKGIRAGRDIEISAVAAIDNAARIEANRGVGRIWLRVDDMNGQINNDANGAILGFVIPTLPIANSGEIGPTDTEAPSALSTGISRVRIPPRPGAKNQKSQTVVIFENAPTPGSANAQRDRTSNSTATAATPSGPRIASNNGAVLARGRSFFRVRGPRLSGKKKKR